MASSPAFSTLERIAAAGKSYAGGKAGSREALIDLSLQLVAELEIPSEYVQRTMWAEPARSAHCRLAVDRNIFQHTKDAGEIGITAEALAEKTGIEVGLLNRVMRHLAAMHMISIEDGKFHATALSNGLAEDNYQRSIEFCYDVSRPSFNSMPEYWKQTGYKQPTSLTDGPFQAAHKTKLPFFDWLVATPPHLAEFDSFMSAYRAGKPNWYDPSFYPVASRLIDGFDPTTSDALLVDIGGGRGHDLAQFAAQYPNHPGKLILQDRAPVIASIEPTTTTPFSPTTHDFFTPQPIKHARAYSLHSILHDWGDSDAIRILENLKPALKRGYSRVLFNEIVLSEEKPRLAETAMDMMMLAHFAVRERTEGEWRGILGRAGLRVIGIYALAGVAESLIEAELE
ncbi:hypothetical protein FQN50_004150 [Emmonsiellopsis sp. PD_5]|nr:hypothetical protein FQN50_004150 [Emmonsiellopsis sp. PD_5]